MKVRIAPAKTDLGKRLGPVCIACGNTRRFWIAMPAGEQLAELTDLPEGEIRVVACGRCRSRHSIVIAHVD